MVLKLSVATEIWVTKLSAMGREYLTDAENITLRSYVSEIKANLMLVFASHLVAILRSDVDSGIRWLGREVFTGPVNGSHLK